jgi:hypothetical protein
MHNRIAKVSTGPWECSIFDHGENTQQYMSLKLATATFSWAAIHTIWRRLNQNVMRKRFSCFIVCCLWRYHAINLILSYYDMLPYCVALSVKVYNVHLVGVIWKCNILHIISASSRLSDMMPPDANASTIDDIKKPHTKKKLMPVVLWTAVENRFKKYSIFLVSYFSRFIFHIFFIYLVHVCIVPRGKRVCRESGLVVHLLYDAQSFFHLFTWRNSTVEVPPQKKVTELNSWRYIPWYQVAGHKHFIPGLHICTAVSVVMFLRLPIVAALFFLCVCGLWLSHW